MTQAYRSGHYALAKVGEYFLCELRYRESGSETGGKEVVKMSNVRPDPEDMLKILDEPKDLSVRYKVDGFNQAISLKRSLVLKYRELKKSVKNSLLKII